MFDFNCFIGSWPFHPLAVETFNELQILHKKNNISGGFVSNTKSIFYRDYFQPEEELHNTIKGTNYRHIMTVNPLFPACLDIVRYGIEHWNIAGVRVLPGFHGYDMDAPELDALCEVLKEAGLPLLVMINVEDIRNTYMFVPMPPAEDKVCEFIDNHHDNTILICTADIYALEVFKDHMMAHPAAFFDPSGLRQGPFPLERLGAEYCTRLVYGSLSGILCLKSSLLHMEMGEISDEQVARSGDGIDFLAKCPGIK